MPWQQHDCFSEQHTPSSPFQGTSGKATLRLAAGITDMHLTRRKLGRPAHHVRKLGLGVHRRLRIELNTPKGRRRCAPEQRGHPAELLHMLGG